MQDAIEIVREYLSSGDIAQLELVAESAVGPIKRLIEASCEIVDCPGYESSRDHIKSIVSQRMAQSRLAVRAENMSDEELTQVFQDMRAEATREVSFALLRRDIIRPKSNGQDKLADELRIKSLLVSCDYAKLGWMWVERIVTPEMRLAVPDYYHAVRHELYYICVAEAVRMHRAIELNNFSYRNVCRVLDKIREKARECIGEGRVPQFKARSVMGRSRPLFRRVHARVHMEGKNGLP